MKKALLVVSFGTTHKETREKTIVRIEDDLRQAFPDRDFYRAWTSPMIIKRIEKNEGIHVDTVEEALERMIADGAEDILVQPTHIMNGFENSRMRSVIGDAISNGFSGKVSLGEPALTSKADMLAMADAVMDEIPEAEEEGSALVLMGHGSPGGPNEVYLEQQDAFREKGYERVFIGTVEAEPSLDDVIAELKKVNEETGNIEKLYLAPFLVVAGDHALKDMTGDADDTWEKRLEAEGFDVVPMLRGLGEYKGVRALFEEHAKDAGEFAE